MEYQIYVGLTRPHFEFEACIQICLIETEAFCTKTEDFDQTYLNKDSKTQNVEELSLDLIFHKKFW